MLTRKIVLALIITAAMASLAIVIGSQSSQGQGGGSAPQIEGSWLITVTQADGVPPFPALITYAAGGGLTVSDSLTPPSAGNDYHGTWVRKGDHEFAFTFVGFNFDPATGAFTGYFKVREHLTLEKGGDAYNGKWTFEILDPDGNVVVSGFGGTTHATRISAE